MMGDLTRLGRSITGQEARRGKRRKNGVGTCVESLPKPGTPDPTCSMVTRQTIPTLLQLLHHRLHNFAI